MTKHDFVSFVSGELRQGAVRFSLAFNSKGEIVLHWTNKSEFSGKKITQAQAGKLVKSGKTDLIKGFKKKSGGTYDTVLVLEDKKTGKLGFPARAKK